MAGVGISLDAIARAHHRVQCRGLGISGALGGKVAMPSLRRISCLLALLAAGQARALQLHPGDMLISDETNHRILHVDPASGLVANLTPRAGSGPNLLVKPEGIAVDPDGEIFVVDASLSSLIYVDPATREQSVVHAYSPISGDLGPIDVGMYPRGLDISDYTSGLFDARDLFVMSAGAIYQVNRDVILGSSSTLLFSDSGLGILQNPQDFAIQETGATLDAFFVARPSDVIQYPPTGGGYTTLVGPHIGGVDFLSGVLAYSQEPPNCNTPDGSQGVEQWVLPMGPIVPLSTGGLITCPVAMKFASPNDIYVIDVPNAYPYKNRLLRLHFNGASWDQSFVATLPGTYFFWSAAVPVSFVPEPDGAALGAAVAAALAGLARRRRAYAVRWASKPGAHSKCCTSMRSGSR